MPKTTRVAAPPTAKDIALELGLSQPTVSRVLAGSDGHRVSPDTRKRVLDAAARVGYRPNAIARSLRQRRTNVVGFYSDHRYLDARNYFLASVIGGLQRAADDYGQDVLLHGVFRHTSSEEISRELLDRRIDGLVVKTAETDPLLVSLRESALPVVAVTDAISGIPSVVCDDADGMRLLVDYLWEKGHRRIAFLRPTQRYRSVEARGEAFRAEMVARGACPHDFPMIDIDLQNAAEALPALRGMPNPPTAVCCWNDVAAYDLLHACHKAGVSVPGELAVVGFDGYLTLQLTGWSLVTVAASWDTVAARAMELLVQMINHKLRSPDGGKDQIPREEVPLLTKLPVTLVPGTTA